MGYHVHRVIKGTCFHCENGPPGRMNDIGRENGNPAKADRMYGLCREHDRTTVSTKNDWTTIYGDGVVRKKTAE